jgi:predicted TIM-barrel fold metal-dependent hydrolase
LDLPVQLHTGLLAGLRNNIAGVNAPHLIPVLELHRNVKFDLFHANWPYGGEWLFLGKNYPNVYLNFCWANIIDPIYCQNLFQQCVSVVPHGKVFAYGSDFVGQADHAWAHVSIMQENLAIALSNLVEIEYLSINEAQTIAVRWLYQNPNEFFKLELPEFSFSPDKKN